ncbi:hypothetical protein JOD62_001810 [Microbacterium keratanolyticum]|nr:DUF2264 domain-containing protein [Microbacterium keratanolyticum]MBM7469262.1 hypothetical protein [Microbacterium keratanolyticum]
MPSRLLASALTATPWMPAFDPDASPFTGYTRAHWESAADRLLAGARAHALEGGALIDFSAAASSAPVDRLEGFARVFLLAALRIAGDPSARAEDAEYWREALRRGVAGRLWLPLTDHSQPTVEASVVAIGLHVARAELWEPLDEATKIGICEWFDGAAGTWCADNNHVLLGATLAAFTTSVGFGDRRALIENALDRMEDWYRGDGWYTDGDGRRFDYYNAYAFHWYPFFIARMLGSRLDDRRAEYRGRLAAFLDGYQHLFSPSGAPILMGRSLIYRWGITAPFWMARWEGVESLPPSRMRRIASGTLRYFADQGVLDDGALSLGWRRNASRDIVQSYSGSGSPYWSSKGFLGLLLPADDAVWTDVEAPMVSEERDVRVPLHAPRWFIESRDGLVTLHNFGSDGHPTRDDHLYRRLLFSSATVPVRGESMRDADLTVEGAVHRAVDTATVTPRGGAVTRALDAAGRHVDTSVCAHVTGDATVYLARVRGAVGLSVTVSGAAVSWDDADALDVHDRVSSAGEAAVATAGLRSVIRWLGAWHAEAGPSPAEAALLPVEALIEQAPEGTALGDHAAFPRVRTSPLRGDVVIAWAVSLRAGANGGAEIRSEVSDVHVAEDHVRLRLDGEKRVFRWAASERFDGDRRAQQVFRP